MCIGTQKITSMILKKEETQKNHHHCVPEPEPRPDLFKHIVRGRLEGTTPLTQEKVCQWMCLKWGIPKSSKVDQLWPFEYWNNHRDDWGSPLWTPKPSQVRPHKSFQSVIRVVKSDLTGPQVVFGSNGTTKGEQHVNHVQDLKPSNSGLLRLLRIWNQQFATYPNSSGWLRKQILRKVDLQREVAKAKKHRKGT